MCQRLLVLLKIALIDETHLKLDQADYEEEDFDKVSHLRYINLMDTSLSG